MAVAILCACASVQQHAEMATPADPARPEESDAGCESLSHRAEVFRSKLIEDFQILDCVTEEGREKAPVYNSSDATGRCSCLSSMSSLAPHLKQSCSFVSSAAPLILEKLLYESPQQMVNFKVYKRDQMEEEGGACVDRRLTRIKNQNHLPLGVWAKWVVQSILPSYVNMTVM